jgi:hypothetical protein
MAEIIGNVDMAVTIAVIGAGLFVFALIWAMRK